MVSLMSLWLPILVSAVFVFIVSSIIHMLLQYHNNDFRGLNDEEGVMNALRPFNLEPGEYVFPKAESHKEMAEEGFVKKLESGPVGFMTVMENESPKMGKSLTLWFLYSILISFFSAYITVHAITPDANYLSVFRFVGATAFMGYSFGLLQNSIWYKRNWMTTFKSFFDGLIYALVTAGTFGWLWPF